jgi:hypothetical protein
VLVKCVKAGRCNGEYNCVCSEGCGVCAVW